MHFTFRGQAKAWIGGCLPSVITEPMLSENAKSSVMAMVPAGCTKPRNPLAAVNTPKWG
jgi:hypothetical protein